MTKCKLHKDNLNNMCYQWGKYNFLTRDLYASYGGIGHPGSKNKHQKRNKKHAKIVKLSRRANR